MEVANKGVNLRPVLKLLSCNAAIFHLGHSPGITSRNGMSCTAALAKSCVQNGLEKIPPLRDNKGLSHMPGYLACIIHHGYPFFRGEWCDDLSQDSLSREWMMVAPFYKWLQRAPAFTSSALVKAFHLMVIHSLPRAGGWEGEGPAQTSAHLKECRDKKLTCQVESYWDCFKAHCWRLTNKLSQNSLLSMCLSMLSNRNWSCWIIHEGAVQDLAPRFLLHFIKYLLCPRSSVRGYSQRRMRGVSLLFK